MFTLADVEAALPIVRAAMPPTPQYRWPLLCARVGAEVFVKHENHTPIGAFKLRGASSTSSSSNVNVLISKASYRRRAAITASR
jgi:threonine dehydratase